MHRDRRYRRQAEADDQGRGADNGLATQTMAPLRQSPDDQIGTALTFWQTRCSKVLKPEDGREILDNLKGFFSVLAEWQRAEAEQARAESPALKSEEASHGH